MSIENILRRKGADVTTIAPEASITKSATGWLRAKNIGASLGDEWERSSWSHFRT